MIALSREIFMIYITKCSNCSTDAVTQRSDKEKKKRSAKSCGKMCAASGRRQIARESLITACMLQKPWQMAAGSKKYCA